MNLPAPHLHHNDYDYGCAYNWVAKLKNKPTTTILWLINIKNQIPWQHITILRICMNFGKSVHLIRELQWRLGIFSTTQGYGGEIKK